MQFVLRGVRCTPSLRSVPEHSEWEGVRLPRAAGSRAGLVGGTRQRRFDGTSFEPRKLLENAAIGEGAFECDRTSPRNEADGIAHPGALAPAIPPS